MFDSGIRVSERCWWHRLRSREVSIRDCLGALTSPASAWSRAWRSWERGPCSDTAGQGSTAFVLVPSPCWLASVFAVTGIEPGLAVCFAGHIEFDRRDLRGEPAAAVRQHRARAVSFFCHWFGWLAALNPLRSLFEPISCAYAGPSFLSSRWSTGSTAP